MVGTMSMSGQQYNSSNKHDHKGIEQVWISDVKAGSVSGSDRYNESLSPWWASTATRTCARTMTTIG